MDLGVVWPGVYARPVIGKQNRVYASSMTSELRTQDKTYVTINYNNGNNSDNNNNNNSNNNNDDYDNTILITAAEELIKLNDAKTANYNP